MEAKLLSGWLAVCCALSSEGLSVLGPAEPVAAVLGADVVLPCFVLIPLPVPGLEIQWTKTDTGSTVHLFSEGESWPESQHWHYRGQAELFPEEIRSGNFSLRLRHVGTGDTGNYTCRVRTGRASGAAVVELRSAGSAPYHTGTVLLCCASLAAALASAGPAWLYLQTQSESRAARLGCCVNCCAPSLGMAAALLLWGISEGCFQEALTCPSVSLVRIVLLLMVAPYSDTFPVKLKSILRNTAIPAAHLVVSTAMIIGALRTGPWADVSGLALAVLVFMNAYSCFWKGSHSAREATDSAASYGVTSLLLGTALAFFAVALIALSCASFKYCPLLAMSLCLLVSTVSLKSRLKKCGRRVALFQEIVAAALAVLVSALVLSFLKEAVFSKGSLSSRGVVCEAAHLFALSLTQFFTFPHRLPAVPHAVLYMIGTTGLPSVSGGALLWELTSQTNWGYRVLADLRLVVLPCESCFVLGWLGLQMYGYWLHKGFSDLPWVSQRPPAEMNSDDQEMVILRTPSDSG
ncbi:uncharacterized protein LOC136747518 isoform X2 [Amia ocellicauda]|uniref:uncharacterized protein LOC136747518 isoform X2 n=1 Tax=Amia ocellicauda TaxID=2972642 RepID=UPI0034648BED